jgi:hypothetical protein
MFCIGFDMQKGIGMKTIFGENVALRAPNGFLAAVAAAARRDHTSISEFVRRAIIAHLHDDERRMLSAGDNGDAKLICAAPASAPAGTAE